MRNVTGPQLLWILLSLLMLTVFSWAILTQPILVQSVVFVVTVLTALYVVFPRYAVVVLIAGQILVGLLYWLDFRIGGLNILEIYGGLATVGLGLLLVVHIRRLGAFDWLIPSSVYGLVLAWAAVSTGSMTQGLGEFVRFASPVVVLYVLAVYGEDRAGRQRLVNAMLVAGMIGLLVTIFSWLGGQMSGLSVAGIDRLRGGFHHTSVQGQVMAMFCAIGVLSASQARTRSRMVALVGFAVACGTAVYLSHSRTAAIGLLIWWLSWLMVTNRWRWVSASLVAMVGLFLASTFLQGRFDDLILLMQLDPLQADLMRDEVGSGRLKIWRVSLHEFSLRSPLEWVLGVGLGEHRSLYVARVDTGMASHNDFLALLFQVGIVGFVAHMWVLLGGLVLAWRRRRTPLGAFVFAFIMMAMGMNAVSNAFVSRVNLSWVLFAFIGILMGAAHEERNTHG